MMARLVPHPRLSVLLAVLWLLLNQSLSLGHVLLGAGLGLAIGWGLRSMLPELPRVYAPLKAVVFVVLLLRDIVVANIQVARLVLSPIERLRPRIVEVPLDVDEPTIASVLVAVVTLTPGTVCIDLDLDARKLTVHALDAQDEATVIAGIKSHYERPLKEIFRC
jgi:multicomponent K+:H+ antiporter subunit E